MIGCLLCPFLFFCKTLVFIRHSYSSFTPTYVCMYIHTNIHTYTPFSTDISIWSRMLVVAYGIVATIVTFELFQQTDRMTGWTSLLTIVTDCVTDLLLEKLFVILRNYNYSICCCYCWCRRISVKFNIQFDLLVNGQLKFFFIYSLYFPYFFLFFFFWFFS